MGKEQRHTKMVLIEIEKLDGRHDGLLPTTRMCFQRGYSAAKTYKILRQCLDGVPVTLGMVEAYRTKRWVPERILQKLRKEATEAVVEAFGGNQGLDNLASAKIHELINEGKLSPTQLLSAKSLLGRFLAQNLKEQEFLLKTGQLEIGEEAEETPEEHEAKRKAASLRVVAQIKEIFGISSDPDPEGIGAAADRIAQTGSSGPGVSGSFEEPGSTDASDKADDETA